ncbi:RNA polymerase sigma factor [Clostridium ganghwense]|uniref:Sigma-70 family RNA polymerase sigma factor n=1 Tax=Clostridium ganghwense TaxID=312089 RepID=A0ABT4CR51_9CLOT|nr:sigma-70 family RNA polymerase sigma factor [Clostridium ganghwense]MCY6371514.1 sigma-70 family RNA polymerase sigma factor [Clostridium ganghwense]
MFNSEEDARLVQEILEGSVESFEAIVNRYEMTILKFIYSMIKDKEASEDITQEVFITVYNKLDTFDNRYKFSNWILRIAKNKCIDYIRKYKKIENVNIEEVKPITSKEISPEQNLEYKETKKEIEKYINKLEHVDKQIISHRYLQKLTFNDISKILEMSESAVKRRYYKVKEKFKEYIAISEKG